MSTVLQRLTDSRERIVRQLAHNLGLRLVAVNGGWEFPGKLTRLSRKLRAVAAP